MRQRALQESQADVMPIDSLLKAIASRLERLREEERSLVVTAKIDGLWLSPTIEERIGMWVRRGTPLGQLIDDRGFSFVSVVSQRDTSWVFSDQVRAATVRLAGQADRPLEASRFSIVPAEQLSLPSAALGIGAGGEVAIDMADQSGRSAAESFYEVRLPVGGAQGVELFHGRSGRVRFQLPDEPLLRQWWRRLRQLLQSRYGI
jgi:putative peptide zinc metalloprotease protein